jgi:thiol-disulfide isomerase/thioredoxin
MQATKKNPQKVVGKLYATWCGHCKTLEPEWKKMKESMMKNKKNKDIEFVEIESENMENGLSKLNNTFSTNVKLQEGYPTIFKIEKGSKKVEYFNGERNAEEIVKWSLAKHNGGKSLRRSTLRRSTLRRRTLGQRTLRQRALKQRN